LGVLGEAFAESREGLKTMSNHASSRHPKIWLIAFCLSIIIAAIVEGLGTTTPFAIVTVTLFAAFVALIACLKSRSRKD